MDACEILKPDILPNTPSIGLVKKKLAQSKLAAERLDRWTSAVVNNLRKRE